MRRWLAVLLLCVLLIGSVIPAAAQWELPDGWGPVDSLEIVGVTEGGRIWYDWGSEVPCGGALAWGDSDEFNSNPALVIRLDAPSPSAQIRVRFAVSPTSWDPDAFDWDFSAAMSLDLESYAPDGATLLERQVHWIIYNENFVEGTHFVLIDTLIDAADIPGTYLHFKITNELVSGAAFRLAGLYATDMNYAFPADMCAYVLPTRTPTPATTPTPITETPTAGPTQAIQTPTATSTPQPFVTWTPSPSPTAWQTAMATLATWQITPDATLTPVPTPGAPAALPAWPAWPTVSWPAVPTVVTVTPFPTLIPEGATIPAPTATPTTTTPIDASEAITNVLAIRDNINLSQIYDATYSMSRNIGTPIRILRGTVGTYMPSLAGAVDGLLLLLFIVAAVYGVKLALAAIGGVVKLIEVLMEFIPL